MTHSYLFSCNLPGARMDHQALSPSRESDFQSLSHVPVRLTVFFLSPHCGFYLILIPSVWAFQDRSVLRNWKSKNPNNWQGGETRRISDFWLCKSAIWAECSRNSWSLFHVASAGIAQKPEGEIKGYSLATRLLARTWTNGFSVCSLCLRMAWRLGTRATLPKGRGRNCITFYGMGLKVM